MSHVLPMGSGAVMYIHLITIGPDFEVRLLRLLSK
jgi:hypothetical protein